MRTRRTTRLLSVSGLLAVAAMLAPMPSSDAATSNVLHFQVTGCAACKVGVWGSTTTASGITNTFYQSVTLSRGLGAVTIPPRVTSVEVTVTKPKSKSGSSLTEVAMLYRGFQPGDRVSNAQSRRSRWAQRCLPVTQPETWLSFQVDRNKNPRRWRKKDPLWTPYDLRAWADPQVSAENVFVEAPRGRLSTQNPGGCAFR